MITEYIEAARAEWREKGGRPWDEVEHEVEEAISQREQAAEVKGVQA